MRVDTKNSIKDRPLITFALFAYNQEKYIREAVEGALSQNYSPLEIIFSDDCSSDRTFEIIQEMVEQYSGPHKLILNRNKYNLGIGNHVNRLKELGNGEWFVFAAGDDISEQNRVCELYSAIKKHSTCVSSVFSHAILIDDSGREIGLQTPNRPPYMPPLSDSHSAKDLLKAASSVPLGATAAWHSSVLDWPCPLHESVIGEDAALGVRAMLKAGVLFCEKPLVRRRIHETNLSATEVDWSDCHSRFQDQLKRARMHVGLLTSISADIQSSMTSCEHYNDKLIADLNTYRDLAWDKLHYLKGSRWKRLAKIFKVPRMANSASEALGLIVLLLPLKLQQMVRYVRHRKNPICRHS